MIFFQKARAETTVKIIYNMHSTDDKLSAFRRIIEVLDTLRERCPWDAKQTNESLRPNTVEEVFELADALIADDTQNIKKEPGRRVAPRALLFKDCFREGAI